jgi:hypothetical protein
MDEPRANMDSQNLPQPELGGSHHLPHYSILYAWPWDQHPNVILSRNSQVVVPKFPKLGLLQLRRLIILCVNFQLRWSLKKCCSPCRDISNCSWHTTCTQGNQGESWLLMVRSQIDSLTHGPSFRHNLCFKFPNGSCELILDIYVPRDFQWYKKLFNPMNFDPLNCPVKIQESIGALISKMGVHLEVWGFIPSHFPKLLGFILGPHLCKPLPWFRAQG